jgi:hypothetical protein
MQRVLKIIGVEVLRHLREELILRGEPNSLFEQCPSNVERNVVREIRSRDEKGGDSHGSDGMDRLAPVRTRRNDSSGERRRIDSNSIDRASTLIRRPQ